MRNTTAGPRLLRARTTARRHRHSACPRRRGRLSWRNPTHAAPVPDTFAPIMKTYALALLALVALVAVGIGVIALRPVSPRPVPPPPVIKSASAPSPSVPVAPLVAPPQSNTPTAAPLTTGTAPQKFTVPADPAAALARVEQLSASFNANDVPELAAYLSHPSADVRHAARMGLLILGAPAASSYLHAAANALVDPAEAAEMRETATFLLQPKLVGEPAPSLTRDEAAKRQSELRDQAKFDPLLSPSTQPEPPLEPTQPTPYVQP